MTGLCVGLLYALELMVNVNTLIKILIFVVCLVELIVITSSTTMIIHWTISSGCALITTSLSLVVKATKRSVNVDNDS